MRNLGIEFPAPGEMRFYDLGPPPAPGPRQVLIETHYSGVTNGTERHALLGEHGWQGAFPGRPGYQHVGRMLAIGEGATGWAVGDWVYYGRYVGHRGWHLQEVCDADPQSYDSHLCLRLPDAAEYHPYALLGVAGVATRGVRRCRVAAGQRVWVAGAGLIGQFAAQVARAMGAQVTVTDRDRYRLRQAKLLGAHRVLDARERELAAALQEGGPYQRIIDACGAQGLLAQVEQAGLLAYQGAICLLAVRGETSFNWGMMHGREASLEVSCHYSLDDLRLVLDFLERGLVQSRPLIKHLVPVDQAPAIYATLRDHPEQLLGVVFDWGGG